MGLEQKQMRPPRSVFEEVMGTERLTRRTPRSPRPDAEARALRVVSRALALEPESILQRLTEVAMDLCDADSAGISILENEEHGPVFRWRGMAGAYAPHLGGMTPRDFGPCGTTIDRNSAQLVLRPGRYFTYFNEVSPEIVEGLLLPFSLRGVPVGTLWVVAHDERRKFDGEDVRVMTALSSFASAGYELVHALRQRAAPSRPSGSATEKATIRSGLEKSELLPGSPAGLESMTNLESLMDTLVAEGEWARGGFDSLSQRELEVMSMIVRGRSVKQISYALGIDPRTVTTHRKRLLQKLNLRGNFQLLRHALEHGVVDWSDVS